MMTKCSKIRLQVSVVRTNGPLVYILINLLTGGDRPYATHLVLSHLKDTTDYLRQLDLHIVSYSIQLSLDHVFDWPQGHRVPAHAPVPPDSPGIKLPDIEEEKGQETDAEVARQDLILVSCSCECILLDRSRYKFSIANKCTQYEQNTVCSVIFS